MRTKTSLIFASLLLLSGHVVGQRQLIVTSGSKIIHRFKEGDFFSIKRLDDRTEYRSLIVKINEFEVITSQDTIPLKKIRKVLVKGSPVIKKVGINLVKIGALYFIADQFNSAVIQSNPSIDQSVVKLSAVLVGAGLPLLFIKKNWKRIGKNYRIRSIDRESALYRFE